MKDLIITYTSENKVIKKEYDHIFDFTDEIEKIVIFNLKIKRGDKKILTYQ